ncbi:MAG: hypothetical protein GX361_05075 [Bacteroidales bacterium]|nr:hypothetical protein [Bacteroidales bacterium]
MKEYESALRFEGYVVPRINFKFNESFDIEEVDDGYDVKLDMKATIVNSKDNNHIILEAFLGENDNPTCPFTAEAAIIGYFSYKGNEDIALYQSNGIALLFPYLRNLLSEITLKSNIFPPYILPAINVVKFLENEDNITIIDEE